MQIINVSEVHRIGGLCPICVVAKGQIKPHSRRTRVGTVVGSEKGGSVVCLSRYGDDVQNSPLRRTS